MSEQVYPEAIVTWHLALKHNLTHSYDEPEGVVVARANKRAQSVIDFYLGDREVGDIFQAHDLVCAPRTRDRVVQRMHQEGYVRKFKKGYFLWLEVLKR